MNAPGADRTTRSGTRFGLAWMIATSLVAEILLLRLAVTGGKPWLATAGHLAWVGLLSHWAWRSGPGRKDPITPWLLVLFVLFTGPLGAVGMLLAHLLTGSFARHALSPEEWNEQLFPEPRHNPDEDADAELARVMAELGPSYRPAPWLDVMLAGTLGEKRRLLALLGQSHGAPAMRVLQLALRDEQPAVRVHAAAILARLEERSASRLARLESEAAESRQNPQAHLALADELVREAARGMSDERRRAGCLTRATGHYRLARDMAPLPPGARQSLALALTLLGRHGEAREELERALEEYPVDAGLLGQLRSTLFRAGWYSAFRRRLADGTVPAEGLAGP